MQIARYRIQLSKTLLLVATFWLALGSAASAARDNYPEEMACGARLPRAEQTPGIHLQQLKTANATLAYYRFGHGSPLVMVTGFRAPLSEWNSYFLEQLAQQHQLIVLENRGVGLSVSHTASYAISDLAQDVSQLISGLNLHDVTLLGWSMGGMIAQQVALMYPQQIERLVLLSTTPPGTRATPIDPAVMPILRGQVENGFVRAMQTLFPPTQAVRAQHCFVADRFTPTDYASTAVSAATAQQQEQLMQQWFTDHQALSRLSRLQIPSLILSGSNDAILNQQNAQALHQILPRSTLSVINDGGHALMYQYPRQLAARINDFMADDAAYRGQK